MITANQLYKMSNTSLSFKEWLKENQQKGLLDNHEKMYNMIDGTEDYEEQEEEVAVVTKPTTTKRSATKLSMVNLVGLIGVGFLLYGLSKSSE